MWSGQLLPVNADDPSVCQYCRFPSLDRTSERTAVVAGFSFAIVVAIRVCFVEEFIRFRFMYFYRKVADNENPERSARQTVLTLYCANVKKCTKRVDHGIPWQQLIYQKKLNVDYCAKSC